MHNSVAELLNVKTYYISAVYLQCLQFCFSNFGRLCTLYLISYHVAVDLNVVMQILAS